MALAPAAQIQTLLAISSLSLDFNWNFKCQISSAPPQASLASGLVDVCLIPEVRFKLDGDNGLVQHLERLLELKGHAMICVAEGAAQVGFKG